MMKKLLSALTACVLILSLAGCGGNHAASQESSETASSQASSGVSVESSSDGGSSALEESQPAESSEAESNEPAEEPSRTAERETVQSSTAESSRGAEPVKPAENQTSSLPAVSNTETGIESNAASAPQEDMNQSLIVYFSRSGNTSAVAGEIQQQTDAGQFELVPEQPYTDDYDALLDIAQAEQQNSARPAISGSIDLDTYDVIYLGFPIWWGDMPMIVYTFLDDYDLSGKTIAPFCTSGGSGLSNTLSAIRSMEPNAAVLDGLHIGSASASDPGGAVADWLNKLGLAAPEA